MERQQIAQPSALESRGQTVIYSTFHSSPHNKLSILTSLIIIQLTELVKSSYHVIACSTLIKQIFFICVLDKQRFSQRKTFVHARRLSPVCLRTPEYERSKKVCRVTVYRHQTVIQYLLNTSHITCISHYSITIVGIRIVPAYSCMSAIDAFLVLSLETQASNLQTLAPKFRPAVSTVNKALGKRSTSAKMLSTICLSAHQHFAVHQQLLSSCSSLNYRLIQANISLHFDNCFPLTRQHLVAQTQSNALSLINITSPDDIRRRATVRRYLTALYISHSSGR